MTMTSIFLMRVMCSTMTVHIVLFMLLATTASMCVIMITTYAYRFTRQMKKKEFR